MGRDFVVERACRLPVEAAVAGAVKGLLRAGFSVASGSARGAQLYRTSGDHQRVAVEATGEVLRLRFEAAVLGPPVDEAVATRLADDVTAGLTGGVVAPAGTPVERRCPLCATIARGSEVVCELCGARLER